MSEKMSADEGERLVDEEFRAALALADRVLDRPNADPDDDLAILARQLNRSAPWRLFYGYDLKLGKVAEIMGGSIYNYSPWLTAPAVNIAGQVIEQTNEKFSALQREADGLREALESIAKEDCVRRWLDEDEASPAEVAAYLTQRIGHIQKIARAALNGSPQEDAS